MNYRGTWAIGKESHFNFHISLFSIAHLFSLGILIGWVSFRLFYKSKHFLVSATNISNLRWSDERRFEGKVKSLNRNWDFDKFKCFVLFVEM